MTTTKKHNVNVAVNISLFTFKPKLVRYFTQGAGSGLAAGLSAGSSCPGSGQRAVGVCTWPCGSGLESRAAAGAAAEPPSGVGEASGQRSLLDRGTAGRGKGLCCLLHGLET